MGKVKVGLYCYLIADFLIKILQRCSMSSPLPNIFCPNRWILLVAMATERINSQKIKKKSSPQKSKGGWSWNFAEMFITLASTKIVFLLPLLICFHFYGNWKFPLTYNEKSESRSLLLSHCRYFDRTFFINVCWVASTKHKEVVQIPHFDLLPWQLKDWIYLL